MYVCVPWRRSRRHVASPSPNISYTHELSTSSIAFLDLTIYKGHRFAESGILDIAPYFKPTNKFQYLLYQSCHPPSTFKGLILGEAIRMLRASSEPITFSQSLETIKDALTARHYPIKLINKTFKIITYNDRSRFLRPNKLKKIFPGPGCANLKIPFCPFKAPNRVQAPLPPLTKDQPIKSVLTFLGNKHISNKLVHALIKGAHKSSTNKNVTPA